MKHFQALIDRSRALLDVRRSGLFPGSAAVPNFIVRGNSQEWVVPVETPAYDLTTLKQQCHLWTVRVYIYTA